MIGNKIISFLAVAVLVTTLAGCQSVEDQVAKNIGEKIAQTAVNQVSGGKVKLDTSSGKMNIQTPEGTMQISADNNAVKITGADGQSTFEGGETRPLSADQDLPSLDGASGFSWAGSQDGGMLSFSMSGIDYKDICAKELALLANSGWTLKEDYVMDFEGMVSRTMEKNGFALSVGCSAEKSDNKVSVILIKSKKSN
jgi:hypothetical protein